MKKLHYYPILTYIHYVLPKDRYKFSYVKLQKYIKDFTGLNYKITTLRKEISILRSTGFLTTKNRYRKPVLTLTTDGKFFIAPALPKMKNEPWDKKWRVVIANVPTADREYYIKLQVKLFDLGFRKVFRGTFISPHPYLATVHRYATNLGIRQFLLMFDTDSLEQEARTIQRTWNLDKIDKKYREFIAKSKRKFTKNNCADWPLIAKILELEFIKIYKTDPHFPDELLPALWHGNSAYIEFKKISRSY